jgi:POT family proton-dependent oligopeptide transporter
MLAMLRDQPRPFYMIFLLEIWERFGFYTVQGILVLYFIRYLGMDDKDAYYTFGSFFALVYGMVALGGYLGDNVLGTKRIIVLGLIVLALGYLSLAVVNKHYVFFSLGLVCVGNGLFKANPANLLSKCYAEGDPKLHGAFTLYYMAINLGAIFALFIGPEVSSRFGYPYAFLASGIGILLGLVNYLLQRRAIAHLNTYADQRNIKLTEWGLMVVGIAGLVCGSALLLQYVLIAKKLLGLIIVLVLVIYFYYMYREQRKFRLRMLLALILMLEAIVFFTLYQQMPTSINLFAVHNVHARLLGLVINPQSFQVLNPFWVLMLSPVLATLYGYLYRKGIVIPIPYKFAAGMTCCAISFFCLYCARFIHDDLGMVSPWWLIGSYFFQTIGELLVSALGVAMIAELVPQRIAGFVMGMWYLTSSVAGFLGATIATYTALPTNIQFGLGSLMLYTHVFAYIGIVTFLIACLLWFISPLLSRLIVA